MRNAYLNFTGTTHTNLWLMFGDNAYENGTDSEYQAAVFDMYPTMLRQSVLWPALGNHDTAQSINPPAGLAILFRCSRCRRAHKPEAWLLEPKSITRLTTQTSISSASTR